MKIYTRTGDQGDTGLFGGGRVRKDHPRVAAYGDVDELNAALGLAVVALKHEGQTLQVERLRQVQEDLFALGAHLATPAATNGAGAGRHLPPVPSIRVAEMEGWIDLADAELEPLRNFILPGGGEAAARLHFARTVCRRAERRVISLADASPVPVEVVVYLNRLSDLLFTLARLANRAAGLPDDAWRARGPTPDGDS